MPEVNVAPLDQYERQQVDIYLRQVEAVGGNLAEAARQLKIKRTTLYMRIKTLRRKVITTGIENEVNGLKFVKSPAYF